MCMKDITNCRAEQQAQFSKVPPLPSESTVHGKEVYTATQKQIQKETKADKEITRKITATETTEVEHKAKTQERFVPSNMVSYAFIFHATWCMMVNYYYEEKY